MQKNISVMLLYPPEQVWPQMMVKPNGSLAYPMLGGALIENGIEVKLFDACVGNEKDELEDVFYKSSPLPSGMRRTGVSEERILEEVADSEIVGLTSIFSHQETMVLNTARIIKAAFPEKLLVAGGVNARHRQKVFFKNGVDLICTSEAEQTIVEIVRTLASGSRCFAHIPMLAYLEDGVPCQTRGAGDIIWDLDELPLPAWHLLPNERYWEIGRPHGGHFEPGEELKYASMMTSLGCPFRCAYCHIAGELKGTMSGPIGRFRVKSDDRVLQELDILKSLGVKQIFLEDDSFFGKKQRGLKLLKKIRGSNFEILGVNGVNVIHLLKKGEPDAEVIGALAEAGFRDISLPFESANPRIISKYASNKWDITNSNVPALIRVLNEAGIRCDANYMIGYPDETKEEIYRTIEFAKKCMEWGLAAVGFSLVMPLPGTPLFDSATREGYLSRDYDPDKMQWQKANMVNTVVPPEELEEIRSEAWAELNNPKYLNYKRNMIVDVNRGEILRSSSGGSADEKN